MRIGNSCFVSLLSNVLTRWDKKWKFSFLIVSCNFVNGHQLQTTNLNRSNRNWSTLNRHSRHEDVTSSRLRLGTHQTDMFISLPSIKKLLSEDYTTTHRPTHRTIMTYPLPWISSNNKARVKKLSNISKIQTNFIIISLIPRYAPSESGHVTYS